MKVLVTGGCGFIGSHLVRHLVEQGGHEVLNLDCLTYAANREALADLENHAGYTFVEVDIADANAVRDAFERFRPEAVMHLAAESHVDRSIDGPDAFIHSNILGTYTLLQAARVHFDSLEGEPRERFRFIQVSTDEVYGSLGPDGVFTEDSPYRPRSPYSASKAAADHLVRAWHATYGLPVIVTHCCNNYGPGQHPEKLVPVILRKALAGEPIPIYGDGSQVREWIHVADHVEALRLILEKGGTGATYHIATGEECSNLEMARKLCAMLDELRPRKDGKSHAGQIIFTADRPGHDFRYAMEAGRIRREIGWAPQRSLMSGCRQLLASMLEDGSSRNR